MPQTERLATRPAQVLVVDDDHDLREALCASLEDAGYTSAAAANGREALDYLAREERPRLILLDLMMPVMSGWEFREHQKSDPELSQIPVVVISAHVKTDLLGKSLGVENYFQKPLPLDALLLLVGRYCEQ